MKSQRAEMLKRVNEAEKMGAMLGNGVADGKAVGLNLLNVGFRSGDFFRPERYMAELVSFGR